MQNAYHYSIRLLLQLLGKINVDLKLDFRISSIMLKLYIQTWLFVFRFNYFLQESITRVANCGFPIIVCFSSCFIGKDLSTKHVLHIMVLHPMLSIHLTLLLLENQMLMLICEFIDSEWWFGHSCNNNIIYVSKII